MEKFENVAISFAKGHEIDEIDKHEIEHLKTDFERFHHRFGNFLKEKRIDIYVKRHREKTRRTPLYFVRLRVQGHNRPLNAKADGYGLLSAVHNALEKIERQAAKQKEKKHDRET